MHIRLLGQSPQPVTSWAHDAEQYEGSFLSQYRAGIDLLDEAHRAHRSVESSAIRYRAAAVTLAVSTTFLAAVAGISVLPDGASKWVSAAIAFLAAAISGLSTAFAPDHKAREAEIKSVEWLHLRDDTHRYLRWVPTLPDTGDAKSQSIAAIESELGLLQERRNKILTDAAADMAAQVGRKGDHSGNTITRLRT